MYRHMQNNSLNINQSIVCPVVPNGLPIAFQWLFPLSLTLPFTLTAKNGVYSCLREGLPSAHN